MFVQIVVIDFVFTKVDDHLLVFVIRLVELSKCDAFPLFHVLGLITCHKNGVASLLG